MNGVRLATILLAATPVLAHGQGLPPIQEVAVPEDRGAIVLGTGGVDGGAQSETWFGFGNDQAVVRNVTEATLTPVLPAEGEGNGAAVIVAPGGGNLMLSMDLEGWPVAEWLADHGVSAFVLKYRLNPTSEDHTAFAQELSDLLAGVGGDGTPPRATDFAVEDGAAALALVRSRANEWGVDPERVGLLGFSAGAFTIMGTALEGKEEDLPAFLAPIYGSMAPVEVPAGAPPLFVALAADDPLFGGSGFGLIESWQDAGKPVEFHLYQDGGHGFGLGASGTSAEGWIQDFYDWLEINGLLKPAS